VRRRNFPKRPAKTPDDVKCWRCGVIVPRGWYVEHDAVCLEKCARHDEQKRKTAFDSISDIDVPF
jgi:hypothetical protein